MSGEVYNWDGKKLIEFMAYCNQCGDILREYVELRFINYKNCKTSICCADCFRAITDPDPTAKESGE